MAHASCVLVPGVVLSTVSCRYSGFGRDHDVSPHFLLHPFLCLFAKSFLLAMTTIFLLLLLHYSFSFLPFSSSFAENLLFPLFSFHLCPHSWVIWTSFASLSLDMFSPFGLRI